MDYCNDTEKKFFVSAEPSEDDSSIESHYIFG